MLFEKLTGILSWKAGHQVREKLFKQHFLFSAIRPKVMPAAFIKAYFLAFTYHF